MDLFSAELRNWWRGLNFSLDSFGNSGGLYSITEPHLPLLRTFDNHPDPSISLMPAPEMVVGILQLSPNVFLFEKRYTGRANLSGVQGRISHIVTILCNIEGVQNH
jgi:hypothetical protein